jgi:tungstate transport system permease protein
MLDPAIVEVFLLTIAVSGSALAIAVLIGIPAGALLGLAEFPGRRAARLVVSTGMGLPPVVVGLVVFVTLSRSGPLGSLDWLFTPTAMIFAQTILALPIVAGLTASSLAAVPISVVHEIRALGADQWQERWAVLQQARRGVLAAILAALGRILSEVGAVILVGGNIAGHTRVLSTAIVLETRQGNFGLAFSIGLLLLGLALIANALLLRVNRVHLR